MQHTGRGQVVQWPGQVTVDGADVRDRLEKVLAVFKAIEVGELLAALPECEVACRQHSTAVSLLALAEKELLALYQDLEG